MNFIECIVLGISSLRRHLLRSSMTILGIVVGVGAVVSMVSIGDGSRALVLGEIERTGGLSIIEIYRNDWDRVSGTLSRRAGRTLRPTAGSSGASTTPRPEKQSSLTFSATNISNARGAKRGGF